MTKKRTIGKNFGNDLIKQLYKVKGVISVTIVGSFVNNYNLDKVGDLDVVIICKKITNKIVKNSKEKIKKIKFKYALIKRSLKINETFGPIKYDAKKFLTVHMMIYDVKGHIEHAINSPFTCFDWQRSDWLKGKKLKEIFPVENIYLRDFFESRRNSNEYLRDLKNNNISIRKYQMYKNKIYLRKKNYKIDKKNRGEFVYHIINNLINNYNKLYINKNLKVSSKNFYKLFLKINKKNKYLWNEFKKLKKQKANLNVSYSDKSILLAEKFLKNFNIFLENERKKCKSLTFLRHAKTTVDDTIFLGQGRNPEILKSNLKLKTNKKYDVIYSSPLRRAISTAKLFGKRNIVINSYLNEINYGKAEGMNLKQYSKKFPEKVKMWKNHIDTKFPQGENIKDVKLRMLRFLRTLIIKNNFSKALVVTHNVFLRCLIGYFLKIKTRNYFKINIDHLQKFNFILKEKKIYPDFKRKDLKKTLFKLYD